MADILNEVDEELKREKLEQFWKDHGTAIVGAVTFLVLATAGWSLYQNWQYKKNVAQTTTLLEVLTRDEGAAALVEYADLAGASHAAAARFMAAGLYADNNDAEKAVALYNEIIAMPGVKSLYRDLAVLLKAGQILNTGDPAALRKDLNSIAGDSSPWRFSARELLGLLEARAGNYSAAHDIMKALGEEATAPPALKARALALAKIYGNPAYDTKQEKAQNPS